MADKGLEGRTVVLLEARRAKEAADLVRRYGGEPWSVPAMQELPPDDTSESVARLRQLCDQGTDVVICLTGVGTRRMFELASQMDLEKRLREIFDKALVVVRGPKPTAVLRELDVRIDRTAAEPNTSNEVLEALKDDRFQRAAVQLYGGPDPELREGLETRGAQVLELPLYRWALPADLQPMRDFIAAPQKAHALSVTSATQIHNLFTVAEQESGEATSSWPSPPPARARSWRQRCGGGSRACLAWSGASSCASWAASAAISSAAGSRWTSRRTSISGCSIPTCSTCCGKAPWPRPGWRPSAPPPARPRSAASSSASLVADARRYFLGARKLLLERRAGLQLGVGLTGDVRAQ